MSLMHRDSLEELTRWEPFRGIERLHQEMNHLFDRFLGDGNGELRSLTFMPAAELEETDEAIHLKLEVPGMEAKDLEPIRKIPEAFVPQLNKRPVAQTPSKIGLTLPTELGRLGTD